MNPHRQDLRGLLAIGLTENRSAENYLCYCETKQISVMISSTTATLVNRILPVSDTVRVRAFTAS